MPRFQDLTGQKFFHWTVVSFHGRGKHNEILWDCVCDCGTKRIISTSGIKSGNSHSCGCEQYEILSKKRRENLTGKRFGKLIVIESDKPVYFNSGRRKTKWFCKCDCGNIVSVYSERLKSGKTRSCGCFREEQRIKCNLKHGGRRTRLYKEWCEMKSRCFCKTNFHYQRWGARGITVCDEWLHDFGAFRFWAILNGYRDDLTIDRIDNNGNYCPENCRWVDNYVQANNTRKNVFLDFNGERHTVSEWARKIGISASVIYNRLHRSKWSVKDTLTIPLCSGGVRPQSLS